MFIKFVFFLKILWFFWTLPVLLQCWCLTCRCEHTHWHRGETERGQSPEYILKTIFNKNPACYNNYIAIFREPKMNGVKESKKITRSKSTSPTRHVSNLLFSSFASFFFVCFSLCVFFLSIFFFFEVFLISCSFYTLILFFLLSFSFFHN